MANISPNDSILNTIKKMLGIDAAYDAFDTDVLWDINSTFLSLKELGIGPNKVYGISSAEETWSDFLGGEFYYLNSVVTYVYLKVRLLFDPPTNSFVVDAIKEQIAELEFRLNIQVDDGGGGD